MRSRLAISYKSLYFVHRRLELKPLFTGMRESSITQILLKFLYKCTMSRILIRIKRLILPPMTYEKRLIIKAYSLRVLSSISDSSFWLRRSLRIASLFLCATISSCSWYSCCARAFRSINFSSVASKTPKIGALESGSSAGMGRGLQRTYKHASHYITVQNDCKVLGPGDLTNSAWLCLPSSTIVEVWIETSVACARRSYTVKPR